MSKIHIVRNRQPIGQFSPEEVAEGLRSGRFLGDDLAWREPMESWKPLSQFEDLRKAGEGVAESGPPLVPLVPPPIAVAAVEPAWERRGEIGLVEGIVGTVRQVLSTPAATLRDMKGDGGFGSPLFFYVLLGTLSGWVVMLYQFAMYLVNPELLLGNAAGEVGLGMVVLVFVAFMIVMPAVLVVGAFVSSGMFHLGLMICGGANRPFEVTLRAFCYVSGASSVFQLIPVCGSYVYTIAAVIFLVIGFKEAQRTDILRSLFAVFLPMILCCGAAIAFAVIVAGIAAGAVAN
jgi:hypothetical protein